MSETNIVDIHWMALSQRHICENMAHRHINDMKRGLLLILPWMLLGGGYSAIRTKNYAKF